MTYRVVRTTRASTVGVSLAIAATVFFALFPLWGSTSTQLTLVQIFYYLSLAQMWNLLAGYAGLVTVGQQGFVGVAAYTLFVLSEKHNVDPFLAIGIAGVLVAALSIPVALFAFRLQGGYFAIGTWVIAEVFRLATLRIESLGAGNVQSFTVKNTFSGYSLDARAAPHLLGRARARGRGDPHRRAHPPLPEGAGDAGGARQHASARSASGSTSATPAS